jgi:CHAT domain-containing protein
LAGVQQAKKSIVCVRNGAFAVLSVSETVLCEVKVGQGCAGCAGRLCWRGTKMLVMKLWKVPDEQTRELMNDFYRRLLAGRGRADALREAQLAMKDKYPDPFYWGALVCQGDPGPLATSCMRKLGASDPRHQAAAH